MPQKAWSAKRKRQYAHIEDNLIDTRDKPSLVSKIVARFVNSMSPRRSGGLRSHQSAGGITVLRFQNETRQHGLKGRSSVSNSQPEVALAQ